MMVDPVENPRHYKPQPLKVSIDINEYEKLLDIKNKYSLIIQEPTENVLMSRERFEELVDAELWLECLEEAGVEFWSGIEHAITIYVSKVNHND